MKARLEILTSEKKTTNIANPRFCRTFPKRPRLCSNIPVLRWEIDSSKTRLPAKASAPIPANVQKIPRHDMTFSKRAPSTGATAGEISTIDWTIANTDIRFLPL